MFVLVTQRSWTMRIAQLISRILKKQSCQSVLVLRRCVCDPLLRFVSFQVLLFRGLSTANHVPAHVRKREGIESFFPFFFPNGAKALLFSYFYAYKSYLLMNFRVCQLKLIQLIGFCYLHFQLSEVGYYALSWKHYFFILSAFQSITLYYVALACLRSNLLEDLGQKHIYINKFTRFTGKMFRWFTWPLIPEMRRISVCIYVGGWHILENCNRCLQQWK